MLKISSKNIAKDYIYFHDIAKMSLKKNNLAASLNYIKTAISIAYHFPFIYCDDELENTLCSLASKLVYYKSGSLPATDKIIFYDSFGFDFQGLTQQYVRAFISAEMKFLYILESENNINSQILSELNSYNKCEILILKNNLNEIEKIKLLSNRIMDYNPSKIFLHLSPVSIVGFCAFTLFTNCVRYLINLTDHSFWVGKKCFDYCIEFRNYGINISINERKISKKKLIYYQYYPILNNNCGKYETNKFDLYKDKVKIFTGGSLYKYYGENNIFFEILKRILIENENAIVFIFGRGNNKPFLKFINENCFQNKVFLLGHRTDYSILVSEADLYITSYPIGGGLMPLIAASNKIPLVCYTSKDLPLNSIDDFFTNHNDQITFYNLEDFFNRINYLIRNKDYRIEFGRNLHKIIPTEKQFNENIKTIFENNRLKEINEEPMNLKKILNVYIDSENNYLHNYYLIILSNLKGFIFYHPLFFIKAFIALIVYHPKLLINKLLDICKLWRNLLFSMAKCF
jgi:hypothetical protein